MRTVSKGFTLIEIAIVLVIIGLLLGGVLKGQELITGARVRNLISQQDGIKAAFFGFKDRYRALPGDYAAANTNINCGATPCNSGNGNGRIEQATGGAIHEEILAWNHMTAAGFLNGSYTMTSGATVPIPGNNPVNPYSVYLTIVYDGVYGTGTVAAPIANKHNLKTGSQVPVEIISEVDRKIDDGQPYTGGFQFSVSVPTASFTAPVASPNGCIVAASQTWDIGEGSTNCGGVSLF